MRDKMSQGDFEGLRLKIVKVDIIVREIYVYQAIRYDPVLS